MTPRELLQRTPESVTFRLEYLNGCYYSHVPELEDWLQSYQHEPASAMNTRVESRVYKHFDFDGRRFWRLASVHLDGDPVMITQNAGREGDDWAERIIVAPWLYPEMVAYLHTLAPPPEILAMDGKSSRVVSLDDEIKGDGRAWLTSRGSLKSQDGLSSFYGESLDGRFERY